MMGPKLEGFFCSQSDTPVVVGIAAEPARVFAEPMRDRQWLNFDFAVTNNASFDLDLRFLKVAVYDELERLVTFRYANRNAVGPSGIETTLACRIPAGKTVDLYNPFHEFPGDVPLVLLRYTFTFVNAETGEEHYVGDVTVRPDVYAQQTELFVPMRGCLTVLDGHDYLSHHRRFAMGIIRQVTGGTFNVNFSRYGIDLGVVGEDGNLARMDVDELPLNRDFHFTDIRNSHTDGAPVFAPADGTVVEVVAHLNDMYDEAFNTDQAIAEGRIHDIAGNRVIIRHHKTEYSHLFHFRKGDICVREGEDVTQGQLLGHIGFSGTATVYSHLHYQLMSGPDFLSDEALPFEFSHVTMLRGSRTVHYDRTALETGDFLLAEG